MSRYSRNKSEGVCPECRTVHPMPHKIDCERGRRETTFGVRKPKVSKRRKR